MLRLTGTVALMTGVFWFIPFSEVIVALRGVHLGYFLAGFALSLTSMYSEAAQLWWLLRRVAVPFSTWQIFETNMITRFYGQFLPSDLLASTVKFYRLAAPTKQYGEVVASLVSFRVVNMLVLILIGFVFWTIEMPRGAGRWAGALMICIAAALVVLHVVLSSARATRATKKLLAHRLFAWLRGRLVDKGRNLARTTVQSYRLFKGFLWPVVLMAVARHTVGILSFGLVARALDLELSFLTIGWIRAVLQALMMLPVSVSGIGLRESSLAVLLHEYGVSPSDAVALAFLLFAIPLMANSLGGILALKSFLSSPRTGETARSGTE